MKKYRIYPLIIFVIMLSACFLANPMSDLSPDGTATLPPDRIYDISRSFTGPFEFDTMLAVELDLDVTPSESTTKAANIIITLHDEQGNLVYTGRVQSDGSFSTILQLPSAPEDMTLTLQADGFESREVIIRNMVRYSKIERQMSMFSIALTSRSIVLLDSDGDLIPDIDDAFPDDPDRAFINRIPAEESLTVAYEDLFLRAQAGDADYNDFIAKYFITEITNASDQIVELHGEIEAVAKMAGYNHLFGIMIDSFEGNALLDVDYIDLSGNSRNSVTTISSPADIVLFESTNNAFDDVEKTVGKTTGFSIVFDSPQDRASFDQVPYNPYLLVENTGHDIHLIGEDALPISINPGNYFQDAEGFPWALLIPMDWIHPDESQRIEVHYPRFTLWRESFGADHSDWYLHYDDPYNPSYNSIVFASDRDGDLEIYSLDLDNGTLTQLTTNTTFIDKHPALSVDGTKIAFVSDRSGDWAIHTMDSDGSNVSGALVTLFSANAGHPSWNSGGTMIAYDNFNDIYTMNSDGSGIPNQLTDTLVPIDIEPSWSPDGTRIAFSSTAVPGGDYDIYTMNPDGSGLSLPLTVNSAVDQSPSWSPDSDQIAFSTNRAIDYEIYTMNADGSAQDVLAINAGNESSPSWSSDGTSIAYVKGGEIYTRNSDGTGTETNITNDPSFTDQDPSW